MAENDELAHELAREKARLEGGGQRPKTPATNSVQPLQPEYGGVAYINNMHGTPQVKP